MMNRLAGVMVVMVMGLTAFGAKAGTDNLQLEVRVTIAGTTDLQWVSTTGGATFGALNDNGTEANTDKATLGVNDVATWTIQNPDFNQIRATDTSSTTIPAADKAADEAIKLYLDNVGKKSLNVNAIIGSQDTAGWVIRDVPAVSTYALAIKASDRTTGGVDTAGVAANVPVATIPAAALNYVELGTTTGPVAVAVPLVTGYTRRMNHIKIDLRYKTPTEVTADTELDTEHAAVITIVASSN